MTKTGIDTDWRPRAADREAVIIDGQAVVYATGQVHVLNPIATLVWQSCDGTVSVAQLADELARSFGVARAVVVADIGANLDSLAASGLLEPLHDPKPEQMGDLPVLLPTPLCSACGPGPSYETHLVVDVGGLAVTVGADLATAAALESTLPRQVVGRAPGSGRPSYGVVMPTPDRAGRVRSVARFQRGPDVLFRSRDSERVLRALLAQLATHSPTTSGLVFDAIASGNGSAVVLAGTPSNRVAFTRRAQRAGVCVTDAPNIVVDPERGTARIGNHWTDVEVGVLGAFARRRGDEQEPGALAWGEYPISTLLVDGPPGPIAVLGEFGSVRSAEADPRANWDRILDLCARVPVADAAIVDHA